MDPLLLLNNNNNNNNEEEEEEEEEKETFFRWNFSTKPASYMYTPKTTINQ